ncbi:MAG TPA: hypothetical protein VE089_05620 [Nitrososphaeraceae archaeon]|nr:hypothetical protein [Nitrososphaeraceae archaeon]
MSSISRGLAGALECDYGLSLAYEFCQAAPDKLPVICIHLL